jgi:hypothetical protein
MKKFQVISLTIAAVLLIAGCTTFRASNLATTSAKPKTRELGTFTTSVLVNEFFGNSGGINLFNITSAKMDAICQEALQAEIFKLGGDAAVDVTIEYRASFGNLLLNIITCGIWAPATLELNGTVVKYE